MILVELRGPYWPVPRGEIMSHLLAGLLASVVNVPDPSFEHLAGSGGRAAAPGWLRGSGYSSRPASGVWRPAKTVTHGNELLVVTRGYGRAKEGSAAIRLERRLIPCGVQEALRASPARHAGSARRVGSPGCAAPLPCGWGWGPHRGRPCRAWHAWERPPCGGERLAAEFGQWGEVCPWPMAHGGWGIGRGPAALSGNAGRVRNYVEAFVRGLGVTEPDRACRSGLRGHAETGEEGW